MSKPQKADELQQQPLPAVDGMPQPVLTAAAPDELLRIGSGAPIDAPAAANEQAADDMLPTRDVVVMVLKPGFALLAPNWGVSDTEVERLSEAYALVIDKYFPGGVGKLGPELTATLLTVAILAPRLSKPRKLLPPAANDEASATDAASGD